MLRLSADSLDAIDAKQRQVASASHALAAFGAQVAGHLNRGGVNALVVLAGAAALTGVIFLIFVRTVLRPLRALVAAMARVSASEGTIDERLPVTDDGALGQLASSFNQMLDSLSRTTISRRFLNRVLNSMSEMVLVLDADARVIRVNAAFERTAGRPTLAISGPRIEPLFSDELGERFELAGENVIEAGLFTDSQGSVPVQVLFRLSVMS
jgi:nitrogen fixation/metabolism regulation signal transduction histidine kinase